VGTRSQSSRGRSVVYNLHAHLDFTPKYPRGPVSDEIVHRCEQIMAEVCTDLDVESREFNGETDHVHLLVRYPPKVAISRLVNSLKRVSARRLRQDSRFLPAVNDRGSSQEHR
jgi:putative transposase